MRHVRRPSARAGIALLVLASTAAVTGCGASGPSSRSRPPETAAVPAGAGGKSFDLASGPTSDSNAASAPHSVGGVVPTGIKLAPADQNVIYTVNLTVQTDDVASSVKAAEQLVRSAGGLVFGEQVDAQQHSARTARATLILKLPPTVLDATVDKLAALGKEINRSRQAEDVSDAVTDVAARVSAARTSLDRLQKLFAEATTVESLIRIEAEIAQRQSDLESLEARQRALSAQVELATVTLELTTSTVAPAPTYAHGFVGGLHRGWHGLTATVTGTLTGVGTLAPFLLLLVPVGVWGAYLRRRWLRGQMSGGAIKGAPPGGGQSTGGPLPQAPPVPSGTS